MTEHDAALQLIEWIRSGAKSEYSSYGYEVYVPNLLYKIAGAHNKNEVTALSRVFYNAAWGLCRRGILRPGAIEYGGQTTEDGQTGGFTITPFGREWLSEADEDDFVPTEPERFAALMADFQPRFGNGFHSRTQEAIRCYGAHAYFACCSMAGAAMESILLAIAIEKTQDPEKALSQYLASGGRGRIWNLIFGQAPERLRKDCEPLFHVLSYWRDASSHGSSNSVSANEAYTALAMLLRFCNIVNDRWDELIVPRGQS